MQSNPGLDLLLLHWCQYLQKTYLGLLLNWEWRKSCSGLIYKMIDCLPKLIVKLDTHLLMLIGLQMVCLSMSETCLPHPLHLFDSLIIYLWIFGLIIRNKYFRKHVLSTYHVTYIVPKSLKHYLINSHNGTVRCFSHFTDESIKFGVVNINLPNAIWVKIEDSV